MLRKLTPWALALLFLAPITFIGIMAFSAGWEFPQVLPEWGLNAWGILLGSGSTSGLATLLSSALLALAVSCVSTLLGYFISLPLNGKTQDTFAVDQSDSVLHSPCNFGRQFFSISSSRRPFQQVGLEYSSPSC